MYELTVTKSFSAAHKLDGYKGDCSRLHGHTWFVEAAVKGSQLDELGMLVDFKRIENFLTDITDELDHNCLNELVVFDGSTPLKNPTAENIARYIYKILSSKVSTEFPNITIVRVTVWESPNSSATYREDD